MLGGANLLVCYVFSTNQFFLGIVIFITVNYYQCILLKQGFFCCWYKLKGLVIVPISNTLHRVEWISALLGSLNHFRLLGRRLAAMIIIFFKLLLLCYYPHPSRDSVSPVKGIFFITCIATVLHCTTTSNKLISMASGKRGKINLNSFGFPQNQTLAKAIVFL